MLLCTSLLLVGTRYFVYTTAQVYLTFQNNRTKDPSTVAQPSIQPRRVAPYSRVTLHAGVYSHEAHAISRSSSSLASLAAVGVHTLGVKGNT